MLYDAPGRISSFSFYADMFLGPGVGVLIHLGGDKQELLFDIVLQLILRFYDFNVYLICIAKHPLLLNYALRYDSTFKINIITYSGVTLSFPIWIICNTYQRSYISHPWI